AMPNAGPIAAQRVLEVNPAHPVFRTLLRVTDEGKLADYAALLYDQALLIEGLPVEDPVAFSHRLCDLMAEKA
ncbi:MAG: molecular chaperone HtpG, partial [Clostridia bacterium]|nr:molecular chaperone HtpG [Clostridia bacterium]